MPYARKRGAMFRHSALCATIVSVQGIATAAAEPPGAAGLSSCQLPGLTQPARCGVFDLPENPDRPDGRKLPINVVVIPATGGRALADPIVLLMGGPGEDAISGAAEFAVQFAPLRNDRDLLLVDQRGTGRSAALRCDLYSSEDPAASLRDLFPPTAVKRCERQLSARADLTQYTYAHFANDLEHVRRALGYGPLNLSAGSYGTRAAQAFLRAYPQSVRTVHLGSVVPIDLAMPLPMAKSAEMGLESMLQACATDCACRTAFPNLREELGQIVARLESGEVRVAVPGRTGAAQLQRGRVAEWFRAKLYRPEGTATLPWLIHRAYTGDWSPIAEGILSDARGYDSALSFGLLFSITCNEDVAFVREQDVVRETQGTFLGDYRLRQQQAACKDCYTSAYTYRMAPRAGLPPRAQSTSEVPLHSDSPSVPVITTFRDLSLSEPVVKALDDVGYESPTPIQAATIPHVLAGSDVVGQAQTGTGKTAAFALPILSRIDVQQRSPQALVLVPTRELAIQVAEAFQRYAVHLKGFHVVPIYGGQSYTPQLQSLRRGVHIVVGTPGRVTDHIKRDTLQLRTLKYFVLDEGDEMLRMGFIDDVEWILGQAPKPRQIALFSATMPPAVRRIAQNHLHKPAEVTIKSKTSTASRIRQRYWMVSGMHKLDALTRILEAEPFEGMLVFTRTKLATEELAERLEARGFAVEALNGDIVQAQRERTIARLKSGQIDIVVATDVAARGLDVERVSHVVNYDVPYDAESYVHRIGRTGRAGRSGEAILFIAPRERNMLRVIERATRQAIAPMELPTIEDVNEQRVARFNERISAALAAGEGEMFRPLIERYESERNVPAVEIAAALASVAQGKKPLLLDVESRNEERPEGRPRGNGDEARGRTESRRSSRPAREPMARKRHEPAPSAPVKAREQRRHRPDADASMETYRIEVGHVHGVQPGNIVGAIANEAGIDGKHIGRVVIRDDHSFVDLPGDMPKEILQELRKARVAGQKLQISRALKSHAERLRREHAHKGGRLR